MIRNAVQAIVSIQCVPSLRHDRERLARCTHDTTYSLPLLSIWKKPEIRQEVYHCVLRPVSGLAVPHSAGLQSQSPTLASYDTNRVPHSLPVQVTNFIGVYTRIEVIGMIQVSDTAYTSLYSL